jgi:integrase
MFLYALRAPESKRQYPRRLKVFLDYLTSKGELKTNQDLDDLSREFLQKTKENPQWANYHLMEFVLFQKDRAEKGEIVSVTIRNYLKATKLFLEMNSDVPLINWKRLVKGLPAQKRSASDRAPTLEEIKKLIQYPDRRIKPIILCMVSGGFRIGSWDYLQWKHVSPIKDEKSQEIIAAKVNIYAGEPKEYYCFITPEAYRSLNEWMEFRKNSGENISAESFLIRDIWSSTDFDSFKNTTLGFVTHPQKLKSSGIKSLIERAMRSQGLAKPLPKGVRRRAWRSGHGCRKFFKTQAEQVMKPANVELLSGRDIGVSQSYYKPTEQQLLSDYLNAVELLTVNEESKLKINIEKLEEKDREIELLKERYQESNRSVSLLSDQFTLQSERLSQLENLIKSKEEL